MFCDKCGTELADDATFCSNCGNQIRAKNRKNIYLALILTFLITGLGSAYAGNIKKGLMLFVIRLFFVIIGVVFANIFMIFSVIVWAYAFYEAYKDVQIANGRADPKLMDDLMGGDQNTKIISIIIIGIILVFVVSGCISVLAPGNSYSDDSGTHYYVSDSGSAGSSSSSSHYGGVDDSPKTIAKNDPDWYYDHYDYGDNDEIDEYLESQGYD